MSCLDDLALEKVLLEAPPAGAAQHLATCGACTARLEQLTREGQDFRRFVFPATRDAVVSSVSPRRWWPLVLAPIALAAAAAVALVVPTGEPAAEYVGVKGQTVGLSVFALDELAAPVKLADGAQVAAAASLRFQVRPDAPCHLWLISVDQLGVVSRLFPTEGEAPAISGEMTLPGGVELDGRAGPERVFAVCTESPLSWQALRQAASLPSADAVRATQQLAVGGRQASVLLEKVP